MNKESIPIKWTNNIYKKTKKNKIQLTKKKIITSIIVNQTISFNFVHHKDTHKTNQSIIKINNKTLMSLTTWNHKRWMSQWWANNPNQLKIPKLNNNNFMNNKQINRMLITKILYRLTLKQPIMYQGLNINTINPKSRRFLSIRPCHLQVSLKKIFKTLIKLWKKEWMSPWWVISHKPVKNSKWTSNHKNRKNNNSEPVKSLNTTWLLSPESHKSTEKIKAKVLSMMEDHKEEMPDYKMMKNKKKRILLKWIKRKPLWLKLNTINTGQNMSLDRVILLREETNILVSKET